MNTKDCEYTCSNCKYFQNYFVIGCDYTFKKTQLGRCINLEVAKSISSKRVKKDEGCDLWKPCELRTLQIQYGAEKRLEYYLKIVVNLLAALNNAE